MVNILHFYSVWFLVVVVFLGLSGGCSATDQIQDVTKVPYFVGTFGSSYVQEFETQQEFVIRPIQNNLWTIVNPELKFNKTLGVRKELEGLESEEILPKGSVITYQRARIGSKPLSDLDVIGSYTHRDGSKRDLKISSLCDWLPIDTTGLRTTGSLERVSGPEPKWLRPLVGSKNSTVIARKTHSAILGLDGQVFAMVEFDFGDGAGKSLVVGGSFNYADGKLVNRVARWDGNRWHALDNGFDGLVSALAVFDDGRGMGPALYAGGHFRTAGNKETSKIAKWTGKEWTALGAGIGSSQYEWVNCMLPVEDVDGSSRLCVGGQFECAGMVSANNIASWDGTNWSNLGPGCEFCVYAMSVFADNDHTHERLIVCSSYFRSIDTRGLPTRIASIASWNGNRWEVIGGGELVGSPNSIEAFQIGAGPRKLFIGGNLEWLRDKSGKLVEKQGIVTHAALTWDGVDWRDPGITLKEDSRILALRKATERQGKESLVIAGRFHHVGQLETNHITIWDGITCSRLGAGFSHFEPLSNNYVVVNCLIDAQIGANSTPCLYAGGWFTNSGDDQVNNIASWDGNRWHALTEFR